MIKKFNKYSVEKDLKELVFIINSTNENLEEDSNLSKKIKKFIIDAVKLGWNESKTILKAFFDVIHWNKNIAFFFYTILLVYCGFNTRILIDNFTKNQKHIDLVHKAGLEADEHKYRGVGKYDVEIISDEEVNKKEVEKEKQEIIKLIDIEPEKDEDFEEDEYEPESKVETPELKKEKDRLRKRGYILVDNPIKGMRFNPNFTVFTTPNFPFEVSNKKYVDYKFKTKRQSLLKNKYLKELDRVGKDKKTGLKLLATAMAYMEGYVKGSKSVWTNNPGNIGNVDRGDVNILPSLKVGIQYQFDYIESVAYGKSSKFKGNKYVKYYPIGDVVTRIPKYSEELKRVTPGFTFIYNGTLEEFLKIYATGPRLNNNYLNVVLSFFEIYFPGKVTPKTTIKEIINLGKVEDLRELIKRTP